jgi:VIT1/CCC1 family predicted Fe2+/Mn2+ transporter
VNTSINQGKGIAYETAGSINPALERFYSRDGLNDWKKGQIDTRMASTNKSFDDNVAVNKLRSRMSGFGYNQPIVASAENDIENARAGALSKIKGDVEAESVPIEMQAINQRQSSGGQLTGDLGKFGQLQLGVADQYSPEEYFKTGVAQDEAAKQRKAALWNSIIGAGTSILTGGLSGAFGSKK